MSERTRRVLTTHLVYFYFLDEEAKWLWVPNKLKHSHFSHFNLLPQDLSTRSCPLLGQFQLAWLTLNLPLLPGSFAWTLPCYQCGLELFLCSFPQKPVYHFFSQLTCLVIIATLFLFMPLYIVNSIEEEHRWGFLLFIMALGYSKISCTQYVLKNICLMNWLAKS